MHSRTRIAIAAAGALLVAGGVVVWRTWFALPSLAPVVTASGRTLGGFCAAAVQLHCQKRISCGRMQPAQLAACLDEAGADCERALGWKLRQGVLVSPGGEPQDECLEGMADASCNALQFMLGDDEPGLFEITSKCELPELFQARSGLGAPCAESSDCTAGFCPGLSPQCHRCTAFVAPGAECKPGERECDPASAYCSAAPGEGLRCRPLLADGARCTGPHQCRAGACRGSPARACGQGGAGTSCAEADDCAPAFYCRAEGGRRSCAPRARTGERCADEPRACAEAEARCVAGRCLVRPFSLGKGETCRDFTDCAAGLYCEGARGGATAGRCAPQLDAGGSCAPLDFGACRADSACLGGRCQRLRGAGEKCTGPYQCTSFLSCMPTALEKGFAGGATCVPHAAVGQACNPHRPCLLGFCDAATSRCRALSPGGARCETSDQCDSRWCAGPRGEGVCYAPCAPGAAR